MPITGVAPSSRSHTAGRIAVVCMPGSWCKQGLDVPGSWCKHRLDLAALPDWCLSQHGATDPVHEADAGMAASAVLAELVYDVSANVIIDSAVRALTAWDIITSMIKSWVFGIIIAVVGTARDCMPACRDCHTSCLILTTACQLQSKRIWL